MTIICAATDEATGDVYVCGDRRVAAGDVRLHPTCKLRKAGPSIFAFAGGVVNVQKMERRIIEVGSIEDADALYELATDVPSLIGEDEEIEVLAVVQSDDKIYSIWSNGALISCPSGCAIGSGRDAAASEMTHWVSARDRVLQGVKAGSLTHTNCGDGHNLWILRADGDVEEVE